MSRRFAVVFLGSLAAVGVGLAQQAATSPALQFKWRAGQTLIYKVSQKTVVQETTLDAKTEKPVTTEAHTNMSLTRRWQVKDVDATGTATLEMQITEVKNEFRQPDGTTVVRDSANPEHAKEMAEFLNKTVLVVLVDGRGRLVEVKEARTGSPDRLRAELPFRITLPDSGLTAGQTWDRNFTLKLDPPHGTGESHDFVQKYTFKRVKDGFGVMGVETTLKAPPETAGEQVPLVPMLWTGDLYFNVETGTYHAARLTTKTELTDHLGAGTKFVYRSTYNEDAVGK